MGLGDGFGISWHQRAVSEARSRTVGANFECATTRGGVGGDWDVYIGVWWCVVGREGGGFRGG